MCRPQSPLNGTPVALRANKWRNRAMVLIELSASAIEILEQLLPDGLFSKLSTWLAPSALGSQDDSTSLLFANTKTSSAS